MAGGELGIDNWDRALALQGLFHFRGINAQGFVGLDRDVAMQRLYYME